MRRIYKYPLKEQLGGITVITARIHGLLTILNQPGTGNCLWCEVDDDSDEVKMTILTMGTGIEYNPEVLDDDGWTYIGTAIDELGYVWHYYAHVEAQDPDWGDYCCAVTKKARIPAHEYAGTCGQA